MTGGSVHHHPHHHHHRHHHQPCPASSSLAQSRPSLRLQESLTPRYYSGRLHFSPLTRLFLSRSRYASVYLRFKDVQGGIGRQEEGKFFAFTEAAKRQGNNVKLYSRQKTVLSGHQRGNVRCYADERKERSKSCTVSRLSFCFKKDCVRTSACRKFSVEISQSSDKVQSLCV